MADNNNFQQRQEAYERAYYEAAGQTPPQASASREQYHTDPLVAAMSDATQQQNAQQTQQQTQYQQPFVNNAYQQPWNAGGAHQQGQYQQGNTGYGQSYTYQQAYNQGYQQAQYGYQQNYRPYVATKDHVAAGLLAIFLGSLGIHKFYLGYNTAGFIMLGVTILGSLFTLGIAGAVMGVISLIEGIIYLTKPQGVFDAEYVYGHKEWF